MSKFSPEEYQAAIPGCCRLRTFKEHAEEIMFCWGITVQIESGSKVTPCGMCEYNAEPAGDFARIEWHVEQEKQRMWDKLKGTSDQYGPYM